MEVSDDEVYEVEEATQMRSLSLGDNGYKWQQTSHVAQVNLCKDLVKQLGRHEWRYYYDAIEARHSTSSAP